MQLRTNPGTMNIKISTYKRVMHNASLIQPCTYSKWCRRFVANSAFVVSCRTEQVERGITAMFLISPDESTQKFAARKLEVARADVDAHFRQLPYWRAIHVKSREFSTTQSLKFYIEAYRKLIANKVKSMNETIEFFTRIVMAILGYTQHGYRNANAK